LRFEACEVREEGFVAAVLPLPPWELPRLNREASRVIAEATGPAEDEDDEAEEEEDSAGLEMEITGVEEVTGTAAAVAAPAPAPAAAEEACSDKEVVVDDGDAERAMANGGESALPTSLGLGSEED
jgi:hypothetical protein